MRHATLLALTLVGSAALAAPRQNEGGLAAYAAQSKTAVAVYTAPSAGSKMMCRVGANQAMAVVPAGPKWYAVIMRAGRPGYAPAQAVELSRDANGNTLGYTRAQIMAFAKPVVRPGLGYVASRGGAPRGSSDARAMLAAEAQRWEGTTPYRWGGNELVNGIDCSGFVKKMYGAIGVSLPRTAAEQANVGMRITRYEDLRAGDRLYFWDAKRGKIGHTGIYVGGGYFTHSSSGRHGIAKDFLGERWRRICVEARR